MKLLHKTAILERDPLNEPFDKMLLVEPQSHPVVDYVSPQAPPRKLTLEEGDGWVRVVFPVLPKWIHAVSILSPTIVGLISLIGGVLALRLWWKMFAKFATPADIRNELLEEALPLLGIVIFWWIGAAYEWWKYRRWGRVPLVLTATHEGLTETRVGLFYMRERKWPVSEISAVKFRLVKGNLNWRRTVANLDIHRQKGRRLRFQLSSVDSQLPRTIAEKMASVLGIVLK